MSDNVQRLDRAFNPKVVAVVGDKKQNDYLWLSSNLTFQGKLYSVQIDPNEIPGIEALGVPNYRSLLDIPEPIDYVIVAVPREVAPRILADCIKKQVGAAHLFTAGFAETGTDEGRRLQKIIEDMAREANFALIGPNCMGVFNPGIGLRHYRNQPFGEDGTVGFLGQSGTQTIGFSVEGHLNGIHISKAVSYGNGVILDSPDFLEYLGQDPETQLIAMYIEGVRDGRRFFNTLRDVAQRKPCVIWKGGATGGGSRATASHTGVMAISSVIWDSMVRQCGAIKAENLAELVDTVKALLYIKPSTGTRVGLVALSGGQSVAIADAFSRAGLDVLPLTESSYRRLAEFFNIIGGSYRNPLEGMTVMQEEQLSAILDILDADESVDAVVVELPPQMIFGLSTLEARLETLGTFRERASKPFMVALTTVLAQADSALLQDINEKLIERNIASFPTFERAARALRNSIEYNSMRESLSV